MDPATFCVGCGDQEGPLYGPVPNTDDDFLCITCAQNWADEHPREFAAAMRVGGSGQYHKAEVELFQAHLEMPDGSNVLAHVLEFGLAAVHLECEHNHVDAMHRQVMTWN